MPKTWEQLTPQEQDALLQLRHELEGRDGRGTLVQQRDALLAAIDERHRRLEEVESSPYVTEDERRVRMLEIRDETESEIDGMAVGLRASEKQARESARETLASNGDASKSAVERVRRLLDQGEAPGSILTRAKELGDGETLRALRSEVRYFSPSTGKMSDDQVKAAITGLQTEIDHTLAEILPPAEARKVREALAQEKQADAAAAAAQFAVQATSGRADLASARLSFGYAENDAQRAADYAAEATEGSTGPPSGVHN